MDIQTYINQSRAAGLNDEQIIEQLIGSGWNKTQAVAAINQVNNQSTNPQPPLYQSKSDNSSMQNDTMQTFIPTKNKYALMGYYFGVFGMIPFIGLPLAIVAIILSIKGLNQYKINPTPGAKGHAITGLVLGIIPIIITVTFIVFMLTADVY